MSDEDAKNVRKLEGIDPTVRELLARLAHDATEFPFEHTTVRNELSRVIKDVNKQSGDRHTISDAMVIKRRTLNDERVLLENIFSVIQSNPEHYADVVEKLSGISKEQQAELFNNMKVGTQLRVDSDGSKSDAFIQGTWIDNISSDHIKEQILKNIIAAIGKDKSNPETVPTSNQPTNTNDGVVNNGAGQDGESLKNTAGINPAYTLALANIANDIGFIDFKLDLKKITTYPNAHTPKERLAVDIVSAITDSANPEQHMDDLSTLVGTKLTKDQIMTLVKQIEEGKGDITSALRSNTQSPEGEKMLSASFKTLVDAIDANMESNIVAKPLDTPAAKQDGSSKQKH